MGISPSDEDRILALSISAISLIFLYAGFHINFARFRRRSISVNQVVFVRADRKALLLAWTILGPIAIYSAFLSLSGVSFDGETAIQMDRINGVAVNVNQNGYLLDAHNMIIGLGVATVFIFNFRFASFIPISLYFFYKSYVGWGRWGIILTAIIILALYLHKSSLRWPKKKFIIIAIPFALLFHALGENRGAIKELFLEEARVQQESSKEPKSIVDVLDALDFANYEFLAYIAKTVPSKTDTFSYGTQHLQLFTEPIPRILWKGKPAGPPIQLIDLNKYGNFIGLTYSLPGDVWVSGGVFGITVLMYIYGYAMAKLLKWHHKSVSNGYKVISYYILFSLLIQFFRDGVLVSLFRFSLFTITPILVISFLKNRLFMRVTPKLKLKPVGTVNLMSYKG